MKARNSVRTKFLIAFTLLFTLGFLATELVNIAGLPFSSFNGWAGNARQEAASHLTLVADLNQNELKHWFVERFSDVQIIINNEITTADFSTLAAFSHHMELDGGVDEGSWSQLRHRGDFNRISTFLSLVKMTHGEGQVNPYETIRIIDIETGRVLVSTDDVEIGSVPDIDKNFWIENTRAGQTSIVNVALNLGDSFPHLAIAHRLMDMNKTVIGVVILEVTVEDVFKPLFETRSGLGDTGEVVLVDENSRILMPLRHSLKDGSTARVLEHKIEAKPATLAAAGYEGLIESNDYRGHEVMAAYRHIRVSPNWGVGMVIKIDKEQLYAPVSQSVRASLWVVTIGLGIMVTLILILIRQLTRPMRQMAQVATQLAGGDRSVRSNLNTKDEMGLLSTAFDGMADNIELTWQKLEHRSAELKLVNQELESFAYSIAHDLRAPLRAIDGFSQALLDDYGEALESEAREYIGYLREGSQEMGHLIDDLLKLARVTQGEICMGKVNLSECAAEILQKMKDSDPERVVTTYVAPGGVVKGDTRLLTVVMENLLGNAWKFSSYEQHTYIEFNVVHKSGRVLCQVKDNGVGFDMAYENKLFEPFHRLHSNEEFEGSGIGLATVQRIIHRHNGHLQVKSKVGEGASFCFELDSGEAGSG